MKITWFAPNCWRCGREMDFINLWMSDCGSTTFFDYECFKCNSLTFTTKQATENGFEDLK